MNDGLTLVLPQGRLHGRLVANIALHQHGLAPSDLFDPIEHFGVAVAEVVENNNFVAGLKQLDAGVGSDVTGAAGNQNTHACPPTWASNSMATAQTGSASCRERVCQSV